MKTLSMSKLSHFRVPLPPLSTVAQVDAAFKVPTFTVYMYSVPCLYEGFRLLMLVDETNFCTLGLRITHLSK